MKCCENCPFDQILSHFMNELDILNEVDRSETIFLVMCDPSMNEL
jgi:hypothetical protein